MSKEEERLIEQTNKIISELVYPKWELLKAYNYYKCKRDKELFKYLEENYGIGNPTSVDFIPLVKKHIDVLIGEYLGIPLKPKVTCKDSKTISLIFRDKQLKIAEEVNKHLQNKLKNEILRFIDGKDITDKQIKQELDDIIEDIDNNFVSDFEIAAQNVITYLLQSRDTDMQTKLKQILLDLLITGYTYFRSKPSTNRNNVKIEVLSPLNTFVDASPESPYMKHGSRAVARKWLSKYEILNKYGKELSKEDLDYLKDEWNDESDYGTYYVRTNVGVNNCATEGLEAGKEIVIPGYPNGEHTYSKRLIPVYEVEWIETDDNFVMNRYETIRIGEEIFILKGKSEDVYRTMDDPTYCGLSINGVCFLDRDNEPYSLMLTCATLLDKYDLLHFYRDNLIANSGTTGDWVDESLIPTNLGVKWPERLLKWLAYKKQGIALINTAQEGRLASGLAPINTMFNGYDDTVRLLSIQAIQAAIDSIEQTCCSITGVFRERLNGIEARDAVTNVQAGLRNSFMATKHIFQLMDLVTVEMILDALNTAKKVFKKGLTGSIILGDKIQKVFTALPEHFTVTDFDVFIDVTTDIILKIEQIKALVPEFIKSNALAPDIIFDIFDCESLTDIKIKVKKAMKKQKEENNQIQELSKHLEESQQQLQQLQQQLQQAQSRLESVNEQKLQLEKQKIESDAKIKWFEAQTDRTYKNESIEVDKKKVEVEILLLHDGNPYNDKIRYK